MKLRYLGWLVAGVVIAVVVGVAVKATHDVVLASDDPASGPSAADAGPTDPAEIR